MINKISKIVFIALFLAMLAIPLLTTNLKKDVVSADENRKLAPFPDIYTENGQLNKDFNIQFETWINDNIGFRSRMVIANAKLQYYLFDVLSNNTDLYLGPEGEFNYATEDMLLDYQHLNLKPDQILERIRKGFSCAKDYLDEKGIQMYYYQCWDKHSIYPESFPESVLQYGEKSKTDIVIETLKESTDVTVISPKAELIAAKEHFDTYSKWGDSTHWTQRGAFIGYQELMKAINNKNSGKYKVLQENDYNITETDQGVTLFGGIHKQCILENFELKNPQAYLTNEKLSLYSDIPTHRFFTNDSVNNDTRLLILGDSYFNSFIVDDIAESFYETVIIWGDYCGNLGDIVDAYEPDIIVVENAERCDRAELFACTGLLLTGNVIE